LATRDTGGSNHPHPPGGARPSTAAPRPRAYTPVLSNEGGPGVRSALDRL